MAALNPPNQKHCALCGLDVAEKPRVKDRSGRYFCEPCYKHATAKSGQSKVAATAPTSVPTALDGDDLFEALSNMEQNAAADVTANQGCPGCGKPMAAGATVCVSCGFDRRTGRRASVEIANPVARAVRAPGERSGGFDLQQPWIAGVGSAVALLALFLAAKSTDNAMLYHAGQLVFSLGIGLWTLVMAFRMGIGTGFLTLCVPFYALFFVYSKNDNLHLKYLFGVSILSGLLSWTLPTPMEMTATSY